MAPMTTANSVRSRSIVGMTHELPYMRLQLTFFGHWSTVPAEYTTGRSASPVNSPMYRPIERLWTVGLPM